MQEVLSNVAGTLNLKTLSWDAALRVVVLVLSLIHIFCTRNLSLFLRIMIAGRCRRPVEQTIK